MALKQAEAELPGVYLDALVVETLPLRLHLVNRVPEPDESAVPLASTVDLAVIDTGAAPGILASSVKVYVDGVLAYDAAAGGFQAGWGGVSSAATSPFTNSRRIVIDPVVPFQSLAVVTVRVVAWTVDLSAAVDQTYTFTCADVTAPKLLVAQSTGHRTVRVAFDEAMGDGAAVAANYSLARLSTPAVLPVVASVEQEAGTTYLLTLDVDMTPGASYELTVVHAEDASGNVVVAPFNSVRLTGYACAAVQGRAFDLWSWLPQKNKREDDVGTGDLRRFIGCLQEVADMLLCDVDRWSDILDPDFAPEWAVDRMLADLGNPFAFELTLEDKRRLLRVLVPLYKQKGTAPGIQNAVRFFLGFEVVITTYAGEGLVLGESELGEETALAEVNNVAAALAPGTWALAASASRSRYSFDVLVERALTDVERARLRAVVEYMKRVSTHLMHIVEPTLPIILDHVELGASELGEDWVLH